MRHALAAIEAFEVTWHVCGWILRAMFALVLMAGAAHGQALVIDSGGQRAVLVHTDGTVQQLAFAAIVDMRTNAPNPPGPTPPAPVNVTEQVRQIAGAVGDPTGAQVLAVVYRETAKRTLSRAQYLDALRQGSDIALSVTGTAAKWTDARQKISDLIDQREAAGAIDWPKLLNEIAAGLESSAASSPALPPELLALIVQLIIQLITRILGGA